MTEDQRQQLEGILDAATSRARPLLDYASMSEEQFVFLWHYMRCVEWFSVFLAAKGAYLKRGQQMPQEAMDEMCDAPLTREKVLKLAEWYYEPGLFLVLAECMSEEPYVISEIDRKLPNRQITKNLVILPLTAGAQGDLSLVEKLLRVDKIKAFPSRYREYDSDDLKQQAHLKTLETIEEESKIKFVALPPYPLPLSHPEIKQIWETDMAEAWKREIEKSMGKIKAALLLKDEDLRQKVRDHVRNFWETTKRRKGFFEGTEDFPEHDPDAWRADWDFSKTAAKRRIREIESETTTRTLNPEEHLEEQQTQREALKQTLKLTTRAYEIAMKRPGKKAKIFIDKLTAGKTTTAAADAAGISRRTGERIKEAIRETPPSKTPKKSRR